MPTKDFLGIEDQTGHCQDLPAELLLLLLKGPLAGLLLLLQGGPGGGVLAAGCQAAGQEEQQQHWAAGLASLQHEATKLAIWGNWNNIDATLGQ